MEWVGLHIDSRAANLVIEEVAVAVQVAHSKIASKREEGEERRERGKQDEHWRRGMHGSYWQSMSFS